MENQTYQLVEIDKSQRVSKTIFFLLYLAGGFLAVGPIQWGNIDLPEGWKIGYKIGIPIFFLILSLFCTRRSKNKIYCKMFFAYFIASFALMLVWFSFKLFSLPTYTPWGLALAKSIETTIIVGSIMMISVLSKEKRARKTILANMFLKKSNLTNGLLIGIGSFLLFSVGAICVSKYFIYGDALSWGRVVSWSPWMLLFCISNGILEEILYRGLFMHKFELLFKFPVANLLQAMIFASIHIGVTYTSENLLFLGVTFLLGLLWGWITKKTGSLLVSILFHAGTDFMVILGLFFAL